MKKRVGDIEEFTFDTLSEGQQLHVTLAVTGWLSEAGGFGQPWSTLLHSREQYTLRYESTYLLELGRAMDYLFSFAVSMAAQEALKYTILSGIVTPPHLAPLSSSSIGSNLQAPSRNCPDTI
ncbi:TMCO4 [Cordylochernes scorpioides]|uniref:TMCO4 n=1 Tax=Cordylochernes scorpioides TaxID=51811 RepID=A0ABY6LMC8_9ARAC|nr:TMCO4 [Cordylochernes scorpioides]